MTILVVTVIGAAYGAVTALGLILSIVMDFRYRDEKALATSVSALMMVGWFFTQVYRPIPTYEDMSIMVFQDFLIALIAGAMFLRRARVWTFVLVISGLSLTLLGLSWGANDDFNTRWVRAFTNNALYTIQLITICGAAVSFSISCQLKKWFPRPNPHWQNRRR